MGDELSGEFGLQSHYLELAKKRWNDALCLHVNRLQTYPSQWIRNDVLGVLECLVTVACQMFLLETKTASAYMQDMVKGNSISLLCRQVQRIRLIRECSSAGGAMSVGQAVEATAGHTRQTRT